MRDQAAQVARGAPMADWLSSANVKINMPGVFSPKERSNTSMPTNGTEQVQTTTALEKALQEIKRRNDALRAREHKLELIMPAVLA